jgi:hypothetical protein
MAGRADLLRLDIINRMAGRNRAPHRHPALLFSAGNRRLDPLERPQESVTEIVVRIMLAARSKSYPQGCSVKYVLESVLRIDLCRFCVFISKP